MLDSGHERAHAEVAAARAAQDPALTLPRAFDAGAPEALDPAVRAVAQAIAAAEWDAWRLYRLSKSPPEGGTEKFYDCPALGPGRVARLDLVAAWVEVVSDLSSPVGYDAAKRVLAALCGHDPIEVAWRRGDDGWRLWCGDMMARFDAPDIAAELDPRRALRLAILEQAARQA